MGGVVRAQAGQRGVQVAQGRRKGFAEGDSRGEGEGGGKGGEREENPRSMSSQHGHGRNEGHVKTHKDKDTLSNRITVFLATCGTVHCPFFVVTSLLVSSRREKQIELLRISTRAREAWKEERWEGKAAEARRALAIFVRASAISSASLACLSSCSRLTSASHWIAREGAEGRLRRRRDERAGAAMRMAPLAVKSGMGAHRSECGGSSEGGRKEELK